MSANSRSVPTERIRIKVDSPLERRSSLASPLTGSHSPPLVYPLALFMFRLGTRMARLRTAATTRSSNSEPGAATRQGDSDTREAPRDGEGDDSLLRVARAGADSPLRDAPRRHFLRGPLQPVSHSRRLRCGHNAPFRLADTRCRRKRSSRTGPREARSKCAPARPPEAQAPSLTRKTNLCSLGLPQCFSAVRQGRCRDASCRCVWPLS